MSLTGGGKIPKPLGTVTRALNGPDSTMNDLSLRPPKPVGTYPHGILLADAGAKKKKGSKASDASEHIDSGNVITLVGSFQNPWSSTPEKEKWIVDESKKPGSKYEWHPTSDDFKAVTGGIPVASFAGLLGVIEKEPKGSIRRINVFSHGNEGLFAFGGEIDKESGTCRLNVTTGLTEKVITQNEWIPKGAGNYEESLGLIARKLRDRFVKGGEIDFFMCNTGKGGINLQLLQETANAFQVVTKGFSEEIITCVQWDQKKGSKIERGFTQLPSKGGCEKKKRGFAHLTPDVSRQPKPSPGPPPPPGPD